MSAPLRLTDVATAPVRDRGALLDASEVAEAVFAGKVSDRWVLKNAPSAIRVPLGRKVCFYEADARGWADSLRVGATREAR